MATAVACVASLAFAADVSGDWKLAGPFGGTATSIAVDPSNAKIVLAGAMNSLLFKSSDAGANWEILAFPKRNLSELTSILIDPEDTNHYLVGVIAANGGALFESRDCGKTWSVVKEISNFGVRALAYAPSQHSRFVAGTGHGVMLTDDAGKSWTRVSDPTNSEMESITAVAFDAKDPNIIYAGTSHLPWKTMDGGKNWTSIHTGMIDDSDVFSIYVNPLNSENILASACSGIYSSADRGDLWHKLMGIPNTSRRTHVIRQDPVTSSMIYAGTTTGLYKSLNGGAAWRTLTNTQANSMAFDPSNPQVIYMALQYEGIGKSENAGERISPINHGFVDRVISGVTVSGQKLVAIETQEGESTGIFSSIDGGESWVQTPSPRMLNGVHMQAVVGLPDNDRFLLGASPRQIYKSLDGGLTWKVLPVRLVSNPPPPVDQPMKKPVPAKTSRSTTRTGTASRARVAARPVKPKLIIKEVSVSEVSGLYALGTGPKTVIFAATDLGLLRSTDLGEHWTLADMNGASSAVTAVYVGAGSSTPPLIARAATGLFLSKDAGEHWTALDFPLPPSDVNDIAISEGDDPTVIAATRLGVYISQLGGKWTTKPAGLPVSTVSAVLFGDTPQIVYAVEYGRLYQSNDRAASWSELPSSLPTTRIRQLWKPVSSSSRIFGLTGELGIVYRN
ncbi:MAG: WD40/YVTN/BNR-like repeat-containing protein [Bryobacteraceae bacterium]